MKKLLSSLLFAAVAGSQLGSTDCGQVLRDPGFDLWCGDSLCAWKVERGDIKKVPTWNEGDPGVELVGTDVAIEQLSPVSSASCIEFDLIADVDQSADVELNIDVDGDGSVEHTERIPTASWKSLSYLLAFQGNYSGIRFEIAKTGNGRAVLAQVEGKTADPHACDGFAPIVPGAAPNGAACNGPGDAATACKSGICDAAGIVGYECLGCDAMHPCTGGQVCGLGNPTSPIFSVPVQCVAAGARQLGELCISAAECATGICSNYVCSTCDSNAGCANGEICAGAWPAPTTTMPQVCSPHGHLRKPGEPCASNDDCASSQCNGAPRMQCDDGRACATAADCPFGGPDTMNGLQNGPCNTVGVQGGICS
jgi:hypothetical protein